MSMWDTVTLRLPAHTGAVAVARGLLRDLGRAADLPEPVIDSAVLMTSELVANAVLHGATWLRVEVPPIEGALRVLVHDESQTLPAWKAGPLGAESGRGLLVLSALADRWGVDREANGKAVWFEIDLLSERQLVSA